MATSTHLLVGNPTAQSGRNEERIDKARALLKDHGVETDFLPSEPDGATVDVVRRALRDGSYGHVIAMGGDGTFREVAAGLLESERADDVAMAMLPTGTANDQGRSFGLSALPEDLEDNTAVIAEGRETRLDAGHIAALGEGGSLARDTWFFDSAAWGMSARTLAMRNREREWVSKTPVLSEIYRDHLLYAGAALKVFLESYVIPDKFDAVVVADGERMELEGLTDLLVKNTRVYAGAWVVDPNSKHDDGLFEACPFRGRRDWTSKAIVDLDGNPITEEMLNTIGIEHSRPFQASRFDITLSPVEGGADLSAQIDGEEFVATRTVRIEVVPRAIRLVVP